MRKTFMAALALGLVTALVVPATAQEEPAPTIPETVLIDDPVGDANYINTANGFPEGDQVTPRDATTVTDVMKVWFTHDAENINFHIQTEGPAPAVNGTGFNVFSTPGAGEAGENDDSCLRAVALIPGSDAPTFVAEEPWVRLLDRCNVGTSIFDDSVEGTLAIAELEDGTGVLTLTFPRSYSPLLASGATLTGSYILTTSPLVGSPDAGFNNAPYADDTVLATDYLLVDEKPEPPVKKGCTKGSPKAKKKGCKKPKQ